MKMHFDRTETNCNRQKNKLCTPYNRLSFSKSKIEIKKNNFPKMSQKSQIGPEASVEVKMFQGPPQLWTTNIFRRRTDAVRRLLVVVPTAKLTLCKSTFPYFARKRLRRFFSNAYQTIGIDAGYTTDMVINNSPSVEKRKLQKTTR